MMKRFSEANGIIVLLALSVAIALFACFGERGLKEVFALQRELAQILAVNRELQRENEALTQYVYRLRNDTTLIEKIAREELGLVGPNEMIYFFDSK